MSDVPGGIPGQVLTKRGYNDYETTWADPTGGGAGGTPSNTVTAETAYGATPFAGSATAYARGDHTHGTPASPLLSVTAVQPGPAYTAAANQFVRVDTTAGPVTVTLPAAPPNGTQVGIGIVTFVTGNYVNVACGGSDVMFKAGGPTSANSALQYNNSSVTWLYDTGVWQRTSIATSLASTDSRYGTDTLVAGQDLELLPPAGGTVTIQTTTAAHSFLIPLYVEATVDDPTPVTNSTALKDDPVLTVNVLANAVYAMEAVVVGDSNTTADFKHGWSGPTGATMNWWCLPQHLQAGYVSGNYTLGPPLGTFVITTANTAAGMPAAGTVHVMRMQGTLRVSATAGAFTYRYAQNVADVGNTTRKAGSFLSLRRVA
jgi:hypothetical protein